MIAIESKHFIVTTTIICKMTELSYCRHRHDRIDLYSGIMSEALI